jgi:DNA-binding PadR family transcriptional regulator
MAPGKCARHPVDYPCTCAMGHLYRFIEPVLLLMIRERGQAYGYDLSGELGDYAFTDADIERAALYRTLNILEKNGYVKSHWDTKGSGPARKVYSLTKDGEHHLQQWSEVLHNVSKSMSRFVRKVESLNGTQRPIRAKRASAVS